MLSNHLKELRTPFNVEFVDACAIDAKIEQTNPTTAKFGYNYKEIFSVFCELKSLNEKVFTQNMKKQ